jgi:hypothetical protein
MGVLKMGPSVTRKKDNEDNAVNCKALPHIIRARSTLRTTMFYKAPTMSQSTLLNVCETYKCTLAVFRGKKLNKDF